MRVGTEVALGRTENVKPHAPAPLEKCVGTLIGMEVTRVHTRCLENRKEKSQEAIVACEIFKIRRCQFSPALIARFALALPDSERFALAVAHWPSIRCNALVPSSATLVVDRS